MKTLRITMLSIVVNIFVLHASAQTTNRIVAINETDYSKPKLFNDLPQQMKLKVTDLEALFELQVGATIKKQITPQFIFQGVVISKANNPNVKSVVIKSVNRQGATFTFTKVFKSDGTFSYIGRIVSLKNSDAYEIVQEEGQYIFKKKSLYDLVSE